MPLGAMFCTRDFKPRVSADLHLSGNSIPAGTHFSNCVYRPRFTHAPHIRKSEAIPVPWVYTIIGGKQYGTHICQMWRLLHSRSDLTGGDATYREMGTDAPGIPKVYADTVMFKFPLYCPKCKTEVRVDIAQLKMTVSK